MMNRRRRNPGLRDFASGNMLQMIGGAGAGYFGARILPASLPMLAQYNTGIAGIGLNLGTGLGISWALSKFWGRQAGIGAMVGTGLAVAVRLYETYMAPPVAAVVSAPAAAMSGDLGYYVSDRFPYPQGTDGPYSAYPGSPFLANPPFPSTSASAVRAAAAASSVAAQLPVSTAPNTSYGSAGSLPGAPQADRWSSVWS